MPKFTLKTVIDNLDGVPDAYHERYTKRDDGKLYLDEIEIDDGAELRGALENERKQSKTARERLEALKDVDPEEYKRLKAEAEARETKKLTDKGEFDRLLAKRQEEFEGREKTYQQQLADKDSQLTKFKLTDQVRAVALAQGVIPEDIDDVLALTSSRFKLGERDEIIVLDREGDPSSTTLEKFWGEEFKTAKPKFYTPAGTGGSGAPPKPGAGQPGATRTVSATDQNALNDSLEDIASGKVVVN